MERAIFRKYIYMILHRLHKDRMDGRAGRRPPPPFALPLCTCLEHLECGRQRKKTYKPKEGWEDGTPPPHMRSATSHKKNGLRAFFKLLPCPVLSRSAAFRHSHMALEPPTVARPSAAFVHKQRTAHTGPTVLADGSLEQVGAALEAELNRSLAEKYNWGAAEAGEGQQRGFIGASIGVVRRVRRIKRRVEHALHVGKAVINGIETASDAVTTLRNGVAVSVDIPIAADRTISTPYGSLELAADDMSASGSLKLNLASHPLKGSLTGLVEGGLKGGLESGVVGAVTGVLPTPSVSAEVVLQFDVAFDFEFNEGVHLRYPLCNCPAAPYIQVRPSTVAMEASLAVSYSMGGIADAADATPPGGIVVTILAPPTAAASARLTCCGRGWCLFPMCQFLSCCLNRCIAPRILAPAMETLDGASITVDHKSESQSREPMNASADNNMLTYQGQPF